MDVLCPECRSISTYDESYCGSKGTVIKCFKCGIFFKIFNRDKIDAIEPPEWLLRKSNGTILKVEFLSSLQKWIFDGTVVRQDELLRGSGGWVSLGMVQELDGLFQLALLGKDERTSKLWKMPTVNLEVVKKPSAHVDKKDAGKAVKKPADPDDALNSRPDDEITLTMPGKVLAEKIRLAAASELPPEPPRKDISASDDVELITSPVDLTKKTSTGKPEEKPAELPDLIVDVSGEAPSGDKALSEAEALEERSVDIPVEGFSGGEGEPEPAPSPRPRGGRTIAIIAACLTVALSLAVVGWLFRASLADWAGSIFKPGVSEGLKDYAPKTEKGSTAPDEKQDTQWALHSTPPDDASEAEEVAGQEVASPQEEPQEEPQEPGGGPQGEPKDFEAFYKKAVALQKSHNCSKAVEYFRKAIAQNVKDTETWTGLAECYSVLGQYGNSANAYKTALSFNSRYEPALIGMADALKSQGSQNAAAEAYSKYLDMYPFGPHAARAKKNLDDLKGKGQGSENPYEEPQNTSKSKSGPEIPINPYE